MMPVAAAETPGQAPASVRRIAFEHLQFLAKRLFGNLLRNQADERLCASIAERRHCISLYNIVTKAVETECTPALVRSWHDLDTRMERQAVKPDQLPLPGEFLPRPDVDRLLEMKLVGMHMLIRQGRSDRYAYFCPDDDDGAYWLAPYCHSCVRNGLELKLPDGSITRTQGLAAITVDGSTNQIGSHLAVRRGLCQYIPDLFDPLVRDRVGFLDVDILSRNRCSLYLSINQPTSQIGQEPTDEKPVALLIVQSAIPNLFGSTGRIAFADPQYEKLGFSIDPSFFASLFELLFRANHEQQLDELAAYARVLSEVARTSDELIQDIRRDERSEMAHSQTKVWPAVRELWTRAESGDLRPGEPMFRLGGILIDYLGLTGRLGLDRVNPKSLKVSSTQMRGLAQLLPDLEGLPSEDNWFKSLDYNVREALCSDCRARAAITIKLRESVVAAVWLDLAHNSHKWGRRHGLAAKPFWIWGCKHCLPKPDKCYVISSLADGNVTRWWLNPAPRSSFTDGDIFVGVIDFTPIPKGINYTNRPRLGMRLLVRLLNSILTLSKHTVVLGYGPAPPLGDGIPENAKISFAVFPMDLC